MMNHSLYIRIFSLLLLFLLQVCPGHAQQLRERELTGYIEDAYMKVGLRNCELTLMTMDSIVIECEPDISVYGPSEKQLTTTYTIQVKLRPGQYLLRASKAGYEDCWTSFFVPEDLGDATLGIPTLQLKRGAKTRDLGEAVVRATRIKVKMRGDTLVYDATAFDMPDGSMLTHLIEQLPGAEMNKNGEIFIRGRKIDELTLGARSLFGGKKEVLLDNLPYYTIKELKVFERMSLQAALADDSIAPKQYVMDVCLKDEFTTGYVVNSDFAGGTHERYLAKLFGFMLSETMTWGAYANVNNINDNTNGMSEQWVKNNKFIWQNADIPAKRQAAGISFNYQSKKRDESGHPLVGNDTEFIFDRYDEVNDATSYHEVFLPSLLTNYSRSRSHDNLKSYFLYLKEKFHYLPWSLETSFQLNYEDSQAHSFYTSKQWDDAKETLSQQNAYLLQGKKYGLQHAHIGWYIKQVKGLSFKFDSHAMHHEGVSFSQRSTQREATRDYRHEYEKSYTTDYRIEPTVTYQFFPFKQYATLTGHYKLSGYKSNERLYVLSELDGWKQEDSVKLNLLPSNHELLRTFDDRNSLFSNRREQEAGLNLNMQFHFGKERDSYLALTLPVVYHRERLDYHRSQIDTLAHNDVWTFNPGLFFSYKKFSIGGSYETEYTGLMNQMPYRDDRNPYFVRESNPSLDNHRKASGRISFDHILKRPWKEGNLSKMSYSTSYTYHFNSVGQGFTYNPATNVYIYRPDNIRGNWSWDFRNELSLSLSRNQSWWLYHTLTADVWHSVDFASISGMNEAQLNKVETFTPAEELKLSYLGKATKASLYGEVSWRRTWGHRSTQPTLSVFDYRYGLTAQHTIRAWGTTFDLDTYVSSRRGYANSDMNRDEWMLNAAVTQSLLKGRMTIKLEGKDLLGQISGRTYRVNAQGRTEQWHRVIPSYVMLHLTYRLNQRPKQL